MLSITRQTNYNSCFCIKYRLIKQKQQQQMIVKSLDSRPQQLNNDSSNSNLKLSPQIKLPNLDPTCIFTSRSVINHKIYKNTNVNTNANISPDSKSISFLQSYRLNQQKSARQFKYFKAEKDRQKYKTKKAYEISRKHSQQVSAQRNQKAKTQQNQDEIKQYREIVAASEAKRKIAQKLTRITKQLGMNRADYKNYMICNRNQSSTQKRRQRKSITKIKLNISSNVQLVPCQQQQPNEKQKQQMDGSLTQQSSSITVYKCNLKLKPMPKMTKLKLNPNLNKKLESIIKIKTKSKQKQKQKYKKQQYAHNQMNKSIRGWTKYGKINQQFQN